MAVICVFTAGEPPENGEMCVASIRRNDPGAWVVHLTDEATPRLAGADEVRRLPWDGRRETVVALRLRHLAEMAEPLVSLDSDVLVCKPISPVLERDFDVALTYRENREDRYNCGVMFSRNSEFWRETLERIKAFDGDPFTAVEWSLPGQVASGKWKVLELPCDEWNNYNIKMRAVGTNARVLHYKGDRRACMRLHFQRGIWAS